VSTFSAIDLNQLPAPDVVESMDYITILATIKAEFKTRAPEQAAVLDLTSEPLVKLLETFAYREMLLRQRINDAAQAVMLAKATGTSLDHLAALFGVQRQVVTEGDASALPPVAAVNEDDARLRQRVQLSLEGHSTAGPSGSYMYWGLSAHASITDVTVYSPAPGTVNITILTDQGTPEDAILDAVRTQLADKRPLCDTVVVAGAVWLDYTVRAALTIPSGPEATVVRAAAQTALQTYLAARQKIGGQVPHSGIVAALHQSGVERVVVTEPSGDVLATDPQTPRCTQIDIT
jgi:phage-related baseplate assembly protein